MKKYLLLPFICWVMFAQQSQKTHIPSCTMKDCKCMERVDKLQEAASASCWDGTWKGHYKDQGDCIAKTYLSRCSVAETLTDSEAFDAEAGQPTMGALCSRACQKHDCRCGADSTPEPVCHFSHKASDPH